MGRYVGVDWASKGWFGVVLDDDDEWETEFFPSIWSCWKAHSDADRVFVDVPIGLPSRDQGRRACDVEAKRFLGSRHRSVFYTPVRKAVYQNNLEAGKAITEEAGFSIQNQAWSLVPQIREVDEFLDMYPGARDRVRETHPEVCFQALANEPLTHSKHTEAGRAERLAILESETEFAADLYESAVEEYTEPSYAPMIGGPDDVLDAAVIAVTARREADGLETFPDAPRTDERGLPMEIVYPAPFQQTTLTALE